MARGRRKQVAKEEKVVEQVKEKKVEEKVEEPVETATVEEKKEKAKAPKDLNEYVQKQLKGQQERMAEQQKHRAAIVRNEDGSIGVKMTKPQVKKGKLLHNTVVSNSITGWQRTLLAGTEVEIVADLGSKITIRAYGMLHTISAKYVEKL